MSDLPTSGEKWESEDEPEPHNHDLDWPWTVYFNGQAVPRWANCWNLCRLPESSRELFVDYTWVLDYADFQRFCNRMDSAHAVESEDPVLFRIHSLSLLVLLLRHEEHVREMLAAVADEMEVTVSAIFEGIRDGVTAMHTLTVRDQMAFWTVGYKEDHANLTEAMCRSRLPPVPADYIAPPHVYKRNQAAGLRLHALRVELLEWVRTKKLPKAFRRFVHDLPTRV